MTAAMKERGRLASRPYGFKTPTHLSFLDEIDFPALAGMTATSKTARAATEVRPYEGLHLSQTSKRSLLARV